ncbi:MAG TPA: hypothetical protein VGD98_08885 [Ktedonobacteraceae bacterium]
MTNQVDTTAPVLPHTTVNGQYRIYIVNLAWLDYEYKLTDCTVTSSGTEYLFNLTYGEAWVTWS